MDFHQQLPVYSPVPTSAGIAATVQLLRLADDPRPQLRTILERDYASQTALLCGSGTQALEIALKMTMGRVGPNAIAALPAFSCYDVATAAASSGAQIILYDIDPDTLALLPAVASRLVRSGQSLSGAKTLVKQLITLPTHSLLSRADLGNILALLRNHV